MKPDPAAPRDERDGRREAAIGATGIAWTGAFASPAKPIAAANMIFCMVSPLRPQAV